VALTPTIEMDLTTTSSRRRLEIGSDGHGPNGIFLTGVVERGKIAKVVVDSETSIEHLLFRLSSNCSKHVGYVVVDDVSVPQGRNTIGLPIPWHLALESKCEEFVMEAYVPGLRGSALVSEPFRMNSCTRSPLVSR